MRRLTDEEHEAWLGHSDQLWRQQWERSLRQDIPINHLIGRGILLWP